MSYGFNKYWIIVIIFIALFSIGATTGNSKPQNKKELIREAVLNELKFHPKATLIDIYKNFFQGAFGPAHMITNINSVATYIKEELKDTLAYDTLLWQKVGIDNHFVRVNFCLIKDSIISLGNLADAFIKTAKHCRQPSIESWKKEWHLIISVMDEMQLSLTNYAGDKIYLENLLNKGRMVVHHSKIFIKEYNPHYRLISAKYLDDIKLLKDIKTH